MKTVHKGQAIIILTISIVFFAAMTGVLLTTLGIIVALIALVKPKSDMGQYGFEIWIAFDKLWNAVLLGDGEETISSRLGKSIYYNHGSVFGWKWADKLVSGWLDLVDENHCLKAIDNTVGRIAHIQDRVFY